jgi:olefin beta-lactone synthetase
LTGNPNIAARLAERAARHPERPAIVEGGGRRRRVVTFGELADRVARAGQRLRDRGMEPGDRALLFVPMSADLYVGLLGVLHAGAVAVFLDAWAGRDRLAAAVNAAAPRAFIGNWKAHMLRLASPALRRVALTFGGDPGRRGRRGVDFPVSLSPDDPALVTFTTGSTGRPKAAARSHAFLWAQHQVLARHLGLRDDDVDMPTLPVFVLNNLALGVTTVLPDLDPRRPAAIDPARVLRQIRDEGVTTSSGSPAFYQRLAAHASERGERIPVRAVFTGGAPVFPPLARLLDAGVEGEVHILYGSTEAEPIAEIEARELAGLSETAGASGVCAGRPVPEVEVRIIRPMAGPITAEALPGLTVERGGAGEIIVSGDHVLRGYLDDPEAESLAKIPEGARVWHRTGDGGRIDSDGRLWLLGRVAQRVQRGDTTAWPMAAEARALALPGVAHAAYLAVPRTGGPGGEEPTAVLCLEPGSGAGADLPTGNLLLSQVREALNPMPVDEVRVISHIPRDPRHASKTDTQALVAQLRP